MCLPLNASMRQTGRNGFCDTDDDESVNADKRIAQTLFLYLSGILDMQHYFCNAYEMPEIQIHIMRIAKKVTRNTPNIVYET